MAFVRREDEKAPFARLTAMAQPEATPTKRVGTEAPVGAVTAGPAAGKTAGEFTQTTRTSPGSVFKRQLEGADIAGISKLAEQPLYREAGQESARIAREGIGYKEQAAKTLSEQPQFQFKEGDKDLTSDIVKRIGAGGEDFEKAKGILSRTETDIPISQFTSAPVREYSPMQAMKGGTIESVLRRESQAPMTTGMAGLDALLFKGKGGAQALERTGTGIRTAQQVALDILQGKQGNTLTDAMKAALGAVGLKVPAGGLTEEARKDAIDFINKQKEQLTTGLKGGVTATEEAYTKAPEGGVSKVGAETARLGGELTRQTTGVEKVRSDLIESQKQTLRQQALDNMVAQLRREYLAEEEAKGRATQGDYTIKIPSQTEMLEKAKTDPRYLNALSRIDAATSGAVTKGVVKAGKVPEVGIQNVITPEDAASYNRLRSLLGLPAIEQKQALPEWATFNPQEIRDYFSQLTPFTEISERPLSVYESPTTTQMTLDDFLRNLQPYQPYIGMGG